jgi:hypothetical protein
MKQLLLLILIAAVLSCGKEDPVDPVAPVPPTTEVEKIDGWEVRKTNIGQIENIHFLDAAKGFCTTFKGLYNSLDSGKTWNVVHQLTKGKLYDLRFLNPQFGYCAGDSTFGYTTNGGQSWSFKQLNIPGIWEAHFVSTSVGFLSSTAGTYKTVNGGESWVKANTFDHRSLFFHSADKGWLGGQKSIVQVGNGGVTLTERQITRERVLQIKFFDQQHGWANAVLEFFGTKDGGLTWSKLEVGNSMVQDFSYLSKDVIYTAAGLRINKSTNGGTSWTTMLDTKTIPLYEVFFLDENTGWAVNDGGGKILRFKK